MGLFMPNYSKPGPGVSPDEPRKKGAARFLEVCGRDFWSFFKAGALVFVSLLPFLLGVWYSVVTSALVPVVVAGLLGGLLAAPQVFGVADTVLRSLRDEPGYWWDTYRRAWKRNARASLLPGAVLGLVAAMEIFVLFHIDVFADSVVDLVLLLLGALLLLGLVSYLIPQLVLMELPLHGALLNSVLLFLGYLPRSVAAAALQMIYFAAVLLFAPQSMALLFVCSFWLPMLLAYLVIYPVLDERFEIESSIRKLHEEEWAQSDETDGPEQSE